MPKGKQEKMKIHDPTGMDLTDFVGILAKGGLVGQAAAAFSRLDREGMSSAALSAIMQLFLGALANDDSRSGIRGLLFSLWRTTEDEQATDEDLDDIQERLEVRYARDENRDIIYNQHTGEPRLDKKSVYFRKMRRFANLTPRQMASIGLAAATHENAKDFLVFVREDLGTTIPELPTASSELTDLEAVK